MGAGASEQREQAAATHRGVWEAMEAEADILCLVVRGVEAAVGQMHRREAGEAAGDEQCPDATVEVVGRRT